MANGFVWLDDPEKVVKATIDAFASDLRNALYRLAERYTAEIEAWMKANGRWTDRTGNLRQSLFAEVTEAANVIVIMIGYGMEYGDFIEFGHQGRFSIIAPALDLFYPKILADIQALLA